MKQMLNKSHIEGYLYEHNLELKVSGPNSKNPGVEFITGTINIATDNECVNIVPVHFTYVTATTSTGKTSTTYNVLKNIIDGSIGTIMKDGKDKAGKVRIDSAIGLNEFYSDRSGKEELVSAKRNEGGFIHIVDYLVEDEKLRNTFECDMIITKVIHQEANEERNLPEKVLVSGAIFDFRKSLLPVEFSAIHPTAISYFEGLGASNQSPVFTKIWGRQVSETVVRRYEQESAFGDTLVREVPSTRKDWIITGANPEPHEWDVKETITVAELNEAITARETYLASIKKRQDEYKASKNSPAPTATASGAFNF